MFDKLIAEIEHDEKQKENQEMVNIDIDNCVNSPEALIEKLKGIEAMSDKDAYALVLAKYPEILSGATLASGIGGLVQRQPEADGQPKKMPKNNTTGRF